MIAQETILKEFNFTDYETKIYLALTRLNRATAHQIARSSGVPANKVYECLVKLAERGFIATLELYPRQYSLTGTQRFKDILAEREEKIKRIKGSIIELQRTIEQQNTDIECPTLVLKGKDKIVRKLSEASERAQNYAYSFVGNLDYYPTSARYVRESVTRGVDTRFLVHKDTQQNRAILQWKKVGVKIKQYPKDEQKSIRFSTFDDKFCRITIGSPEITREEEYLSFWIESPAFSSLLKDQFLEMWKHAKDV